MDYLGVLEDDELSHLSERMTPVEFDRIALQYLKLKKTRLDQFKEDAGRNCVNYMLTALHHWRDTQNPDTARKVLIRHLQAAARQGLINREDFTFLETGLVENQTNAQKPTRSEVFFQLVRKAERKCIDCPILILNMFAFIPFGISLAGLFLLHKDYLNGNRSTDMLLPPFDFDIDDMYQNILDNDKYLIIALCFPSMMTNITYTFSCISCCVQRILKKYRMRAENFDKTMTIFFVLVWVFCYTPVMFYTLYAMKKYYSFEVDHKVFHKWTVGRLQYYDSSIDKPNIIKRSVFHHEYHPNTAYRFPSHKTNTESMEQLKEDLDDIMDMWKDFNRAWENYPTLPPFDFEPITIAPFIPIEPLKFHSRYHERKSWNLMQLAFRCCGVDNYKDWKAKLQPNVPDSCCISVYQGCGSDVFGNKSKSQNIQEKGCFPFLKAHFDEYVHMETFDFQLYCLSCFIGLLFLSILLFLCARSRRSLPIMQRDINHTDVDAEIGYAEDEGDSDEYDNEEDEEDEDDVELLQVGRNESDNESDSDLDWLENSDEDGLSVNVQNSEQGSNDFIINIKDSEFVITPQEHQASPANLITF